jgi:predicted  nucleic acid-binding Zn-ribbon protein
MAKLNVAEMNKQIEAKLKELKSGQAKTKRAQKIVSKVDAKVDELRDELKQIRLELDQRRAVLKEVREDLRVSELEEEVKRLRAEVGGVPDGLVELDTDDEQITQLESSLDSLSGLIEEGLATRDRLLDRLDRLREREAEAEKVLDEATKGRDEDREALERMRARRKKIKERVDRPSPHFAYAEFDCRNGKKLPKEAEPAVKDWCERIGEPLRKRFGPVHINSAYRPSDYNASINGASNSVHIYDFPDRNFATVAVDITCETGSPAEWYAFTEGKANGRGLYATFHHADTRGRIGWSDATWSG